MPLSENEQRLLEQMERALYQEDPKFATSMRGARRRTSSGRRMLVAGIALVVGLLLFVLGVTQNVFIGVLGFAVMMAGTVYAITGPRRSGPVGVVGETGSVRGRPAAASKRSSFMQRIEERWDRRRDQR